MTVFQGLPQLINVLYDRQCHNVTLSSSSSTIKLSFRQLFSNKLNMTGFNDELCCFK